MSWYTMQQHHIKQINRRGQMKSGYQELVWVRDRKGKEYVCNLSSEDVGKSFEQLSDEKQNRCSDVNQIVGTERW